MESIGGGAPGSQTITLMKIGHYKIGGTLGSGTFGKVKCKYIMIFFQ